ncbi:hypothetical protein D3C81_1832390 [compost metagenome]
MPDELQVRPHRQPLGQVNTVVELGVVLDLLDRQVSRVIVILDTIGRIGQRRILAVRRVHMHLGHCKADVILRPCREQPLVHRAYRHIVVDLAGLLVMHRGHGEQAQSA